MTHIVIIMGVAGCGKSSVALALAAQTGARLIEGDDYHSPASRDKMAKGVPLDDADRKDWLESLGKIIHCASEDTVLTCSALKRAYRNSLRAACSDLRFIYLAISPTEALQRVSARAGEHFFPANLVASQFGTLEIPEAESDVFTIDATVPVDELASRVADWLNCERNG